MAKKKEKGDSSGKVKVVCRFRPLNAFEIAQGGSLDIKIENNETVRLNKTNISNDIQHQYTFDHAFNVNSAQNDVYQIAAQPVVESVFDGFNGTIIAYGQTASGKTYTMEGKSKSDRKTRGIIPRMVENVFKYIDESPDYIEFMVKVSILEIYMEELRDLLDPKRKKNMKIRSDKHKGIYVEKLTEVYVSTPEEVFKFLKIGKKNRSVGRTNMNLVSSRSHLLVNLTLHQNDTKNEIAKNGKLLMVDLAGSEKVSKTKAEGKTFEESKQINQSLLYLGNVINALNEGKHVPYRNSQLTRLLEQSLGGNSKTTLIINCSPADYNEHETLSTLRFGTRAQNVVNDPTQNCEFTLDQLEKMVLKLQHKNKQLYSIIDYLKTVIRTNMPDYELKAGLQKLLQRRKKNVPKANSIAPFALKDDHDSDESSGFFNPQDSSNRMKSPRGGKSVFQDMRHLKNEVVNYKEKAENLKFENIRLQKLLSESSSDQDKSNPNKTVSSMNFDQFSDSGSNIIPKVGPFDSSNGKSDRVIKDFLELDSDEEFNSMFSQQLKSFSLSSDVQRSLKKMFRKMEEKNIVLKSKMEDMKLLMSDMMANFKDLVSKDYEDLQQLHQEIVVKSLDEDKKYKTEGNAEVANLLSVYHNENKTLKKEIETLRDALEAKETFWEKQKSGFNKTLVDHDTKMRRLQKILGSFMKGTVLDMAAGGDDIKDRKPGEKLLDWDNFAESLKIESKITKEKIQEKKPKEKVEIKKPKEKPKEKKPKEIPKELIEEKIVDLDASIEDSLFQDQSSVSSLILEQKPQKNVVKKIRGGTYQNLDKIGLKDDRQNLQRRPLEVKEPPTVTLSIYLSQNQLTIQVRDVELP